MIESNNSNSENQRGTLIIELALVVGLLAFAAMGGLEIAYYLQRSQVGVSLTRELANNIARECYDVCSISRTATCAGREVQTIQAIASQLDPTMRVRARIWQRNVNDPETASFRSNVAPCTLLPKWTFSTVQVNTAASALAGDAPFRSRRANRPPAAVSIDEHPSAIQIIAEVEADHSSLTGFALAIFGSNSVYYNGTLI